LKKEGISMVTQTEIAKAVGLDVSSVNKILNRCRGPVFRKETIRSVFKTAREMGYDFDRAGKGTFRAILEELFPSTHGVRVLSVIRGTTRDQTVRIMRLLYGRSFKPFPKEERPL